MEEIRVPTRAGGTLDAVLSDRRSAILAMVLVVTLTAVGVLLAARSTPTQVAPPATYESWSPSVAGSPALPGGLVVTVHVAGEVKRPGLYPLPAGSRFADAVAAAGGPTAKGDLDLVNLAQPLVDGTKVEVPSRSAPGSTGVPVTAGAPSGAPALISLNSADEAALETIPGIGPVTAAAILAHRDEIGGFTSLEQLLDVSGIGPATYESMRDFVTL